MREGIVFYRSFYDSIKELPDEQLANCFKAIMEYGLNDLEPQTGGIEKTVFLLVKPQIDKNNERYENGKNGGRPKTKPKPNNNQTETKPKPNNNQTITKQEPKDKDKVKDKVKDKDKKESTLKCTKEKPNQRFVPPTLENVSGYCQEKGYKVDCERFIDFYSSKGWYVGKNKMKDWKASVRNWARQDKSNQLPKVKTNTSHNFSQREDYDFDAIELQSIKKMNRS